MIILASKSPRRHELLAQLGVNFIYKVSDIDEKPLNNETAVDLVARLAAAKAQAVYDQLDDSSDTIVLGSDTVVSVDQHILGKPKNQQEAAEMLALLSGRTHQVLTAVTLVKESEPSSVIVSNDVTFRVLKDEEIEAYWQTGEPSDKAGSYAIQGLAAQFISHLQGSYSAVMGLPLYETAQLLQQAGISLLHNNK